MYFITKLNISPSFRNTNLYQGSIIDESRAQTKGVGGNLQLEDILVPFTQSKKKKRIYSTFQGQRWRELEEVKHWEDSNMPCNLAPEPLEDAS